MNLGSKLSNISSWQTPYQSEQRREKGLGRVRIEGMIKLGHKDGYFYNFLIKNSCILWLCILVGESSESRTVNGY